MTNPKIQKLELFKQDYDKNPFEYEIPYYRPINEKKVNNLYDWCTNLKDTPDMVKHRCKAIMDSPGLGKTATVRYVSRDCWLFEINSHKDLGLAKRLDLAKDRLGESNTTLKVRAELENVVSSYLFDLLAMVDSHLKKNQFVQGSVYMLKDAVNDSNTDILTTMKSIEQFRKGINIVLHFDEFQNWASARDAYWDYNATLESAEYKNWYASALSSTINRYLLKYDYFRVFFTGTSCDIGKYLRFGSDIKVENWTLDHEFDKDFVLLILDHFVNPNLLPERDELAEYFAGRPRNVQFLLNVLYENRYARLDVKKIKEDGFHLFQKEMNQFDNTGDTQKALYDLYIVMVFFRAFNGVKEGNLYKFELDFLSPNIRDLSKSGLIRIQSDTEDVIYQLFPLLERYFESKRMINVLDSSYFQTLFTAAQFSVNNVNQGFGYTFQMAIALELLHYSSSLHTEILGDILQSPRLTKLERFVLFSEIQSNLSSQCVFLVKDKPVGKSAENRYIDVAYNLPNQKWVRIEAKNTDIIDDGDGKQRKNERRRQEELRTDCLSFFKKCQENAQKGSLNVFVCSNSIAQKGHSGKMKQITAFTDGKTDPTQNYRLIEHVGTMDGLYLPFDEICKKENYTKSYSKMTESPLFVKLNQLYVKDARVLYVHELNPTNCLDKVRSFAAGKDLGAYIEGDVLVNTFVYTQLTDNFYNALLALNIVCLRPAVE